MAGGLENILGVNFKAGDAYLALVVSPGTPRLDVVTKKLEPAAHVGRWSQLRQFGERIVVEARALDCVAVAFAEPRKYNQWAYYQASERAALQAAAGLALDAAGFEVHEVAQVTASTALGFKKLAELDKRFADSLNIDPKSVVHWNARYPALAAAMCVAKKRWP